MYPAAQTYWLEPTDQVQVGLRRYVWNFAAGTYDCANGWHEALVITGQERGNFDDEGFLQMSDRETPHDDPAWPLTCSQGCGYEFTDDDRWQDWRERLWLRSDTGELITIRDAPPGACWDASWLPYCKGPDGITLTVKLPNGHDWTVDSQASNCTRKGEAHKCWIRHGDPRDCKVTVDKNGDTCSAGAGSIQAGDYHGFLRAGILTEG